MPEEILLREHHFYVSAAKFVFLHPRHGIVSVRDPIKLTDAPKYDLRPLILYGLTVAGLPIRWMTFTPLDEPRPFRQILLQAWSEAEGLRGRPDILRVNRHIASSSANLQSDLRRIGVELVITNSTEKSHPASLRSAQDASRWVPDGPDSSNQPDLDPIDRLSMGAAARHKFQAQASAHVSESRTIRENICRWLAFPIQDAGSLPCYDPDWHPGAWLSSWQSSLPPDQPRHFNYDDPKGRVWLLSGKSHHQEYDDDDEITSDTNFDNAAEIASDLISCWPNPPAEISASVGITLKELQWFITGKADLSHNSRAQLEELLGIVYEERSGCFTAFGPCVLIARKPQAFERAYTELSGGGDACPSEIIPSSGSADPSWRYFMVNALGAPPSIVMVSRGDKILDRIDDLMLNFSGTVSVPRPVYQDVVSVCAKACRAPEENVRSMMDFAKRYQNWADRVWYPG